MQGSAIIFICPHLQPLNMTKYQARVKAFFSTCSETLAKLMTLLFATTWQSPT